MRHLKTIQVPATVKEIIEKVTCDLCDREIPPSGGDYEINEVEVRHRSGTNYPTGGDGQETKVDMCGNCFDTKLVPWLRTQGANPRPVDWSW